MSFSAIAGFCIIEMGKGCKVVVCGLASVGKTAILEQLLYGNHAVGKLMTVNMNLPVLVRDEHCKMCL